jgi:hypothetical protein
LSLFSFLAEQYIIVKNIKRNTNPPIVATKIRINPFKLEETIIK